MATISFLYRSIKDKAPLNVRLLFRIVNEDNQKDFKDYVFGAKTKIEVSKHYWNKQHNLVRVRDADIINEQESVKAKLKPIRDFLLKAFEQHPKPEQITRDWLKQQIYLFYNPNQDQIKKPKDLTSFIDYYISEKEDEVKEATIYKIQDD